MKLGLSQALYAKLTSQARLLIDDADEGSDPQLNVMILGAGEFDTEQIDRLVKCGATVRTVAGDVATAFVNLSKLAEVLSEGSVRQLDASRPLWPED